jgi:hypothetical protein
MLNLSLSTVTVAVPGIGSRGGPPADAILLANSRDAWMWSAATFLIWR